MAMKFGMGKSLLAEDDDKKKEKDYTVSEGSLGKPGEAVTSPAMRKSEPMPGAADDVPDEEAEGEEKATTMKELTVTAKKPEAKPAPAPEVKKDIDWDKEEVEEEPKRGRWNEQLFREMNDRYQLSEEELKKQKRREIAQKAIAGFGDIATAAVNMAYANKGATPPAIPQGTPTMSGRYADKWAKWYEDYKQNRDKYAQGLENARKQDYAEYKADRDYKLRAEKEANDREIANIKIELDRAKLAEGIAKTEKRNEVEMKKLEAQTKYWEDRLRNAQTKKGTSKEPYAGTFEGRAYKTQADLRDAIITRAISLGIKPTRTEQYKDASGNDATREKTKSLQDLLYEIKQKTGK